MSLQVPRSFHEADCFFEKSADTEINHPVVDVYPLPPCGHHAQIGQAGELIRQGLGFEGQTPGKISRRDFIFLTKEVENAQTGVVGKDLEHAGDADRLNGRKMIFRSQGAVCFAAGGFRIGHAITLVGEIMKSIDRSKYL